MADGNGRKYWTCKGGHALGLIVHRSSRKGGVANGRGHGTRLLLFAEALADGPGLVVARLDGEALRLRWTCSICNRQTDWVRGAIRKQNRNSTR